MKKIIFLFLISCLVFKANSQTTTAIPFLLIATDARAGSMGDIGVATSSDAFSLFHNPSKIAFNENGISIGVSYVPWLRNLTDDIFVGNISVINRFSENQAWGADIKYFSLGEINLTTDQGLPNGFKKPSEFAISGYYALKLSETFSMSVGLKYINSNYDIDDDFDAVNGFAVDVSGYYRSPEENYGTFNGRYRLGFNIANIGPKVSYTPGEDNFIPTNLKLGGGFDFILDDFNIVSVNLEFTKLLVSSDINDGWFEGMFSSFDDPTPTWALGAEYLYNKAFAIRAGYFNESESNGNRQFYTMGAGFKARAFSIDLSYLINYSDIKNPLENTLRFSLAFDLGEIYDDY